jgi:hypothetical protein
MADDRAMMFLQSDSELPKGMIERCANCKARVLGRGVRDKLGIFCSMVCRNNVAHPGFCNACIAATTPVLAAGSNITINGIGHWFYGTTDPCKTCGSVVRNRWLCILFIPVLRVGTFRVKYSRTESLFDS